MKILKSWLQDHIVEKLPDDEKIIEAFTFKSSEVEGSEKVKIDGKDDTVFDLKVLPDRAHYMLSHKGVAYDLCAILNLSLKSDKIEILKKGDDVLVKVESNLCSRYSAVLIKNIKNTQSPKWLKDRLEAIGARSINAIVDISNYAMFDTGQPLHAFDADKLVGSITVRLAKQGESIETLSGQVIELKSHHLVIADDRGPLALAGVKGGKRAEVTLETKNIILESANFNPVSVRKTSLEVGIRNDSSRRFENEITPYLTERGVSKFIKVLKSVVPGCEIGTISDIYKKLPESWKVSLAHKNIESILNYSISEKKVIDILEKLECAVTSKNGIYEVIPPFERLDLVIPEDIIDEVGRIEGLDKIKSIVPKLNTNNEFSQEFLLTEKIKDFLVSKGFSEVITRSFTDKGDIEVAYPMASDKNFLRNNIHDNLLQSIELAVKNAPLLGEDEIRIFEIGKIFTKDGEQTSCVAGIRNIKKKQEKEKDKIKLVRDELLQELNVSDKTIGLINNIDGVLEINIDALGGLESYKLNSIKIEKGSRLQFVPFSTFPFMTRDIALFVENSVDIEIVKKVIQDSLRLSAKGLLTKGPDLFDQFEKEGKKSLAFRMIFQSNDRTLTIEEVNGFMEKLAVDIKGKGWQVR